MLPAAIAALVFAALPLVSAEISWDQAYTKAKAALNGLSLEDKVGIVTGVGWNAGQPCVGNNEAVASIGYPSLCLQDGPLGIRYAKAGTSTAFVPAIHAASTWDIDLIRERGKFHAEEARTKGVHVILGPVAGALGKVAAGGRNWEGWSPDPYLTGIAAGVTIEAMQAVGVQSTIKHYILNEQELNRDSMSSSVDDRTMHELYLWPFSDSVRAGVTAAMCSYNQIDGTWACENDHIMNELLKEELGFPGYIMTDWGAQHSTVEAAIAGLDLSMPGTDWGGGARYWGENLTKAVNDGRVPKARVDDMVTRLLASWYKVEQDKGFPAQVDLARPATSSAHSANVRATARDGTILLKNQDGILPFVNPTGIIGVVGSAAVSGDHANNVCVDKGCSDGAIGMGWGSGTVEYPYFVSPHEAISEKAAAGGVTVQLSDSDDPAKGASVADGADVVIVFITSYSGEGYITVEGNAGDRNNLDPWHNGNQLVAAVAEKNENVIVVVHSTGPIILDSILSHGSVKGVVWGGLPSQESGNALVDILWGESNPSGKLPFTIAKKASDYNAQVVNGDDSFTDGVYIDYRHFDAKDIEPQFEFGFGLSYTEFTYSDLSIESSAKSGPATGPIVPGGNDDLYDEVATVTATITNSGALAGSEVVQLYIRFPESADTPLRQLRGFTKLPLAAGASGTASFSLRKRDLSVWNSANQVWTVPSGEFGVEVSASSRDIRVDGNFTIS